MSLRDQLQAVYDERGKLTPAILVETARDPEHPLHARFEWDDRVAGEAYRRQQAHELIRSVKVTYQRGDEERKVRAYHAVPSEDSPQPSYEPVEKVADDPFIRQLVLKNAEREWRALKARYADLDEFFSIVRRDLDAGAA